MVPSVSVSVSKVSSCLVDGHHLLRRQPHVVQRLVGIYQRQLLVRGRTTGEVVHEPLGGDVGWTDEPAHHILDVTIRLWAAGAVQTHCHDDSLMLELRGASSHA